MKKDTTKKMSANKSTINANNTNVNYQFPVVGIGASAGGLEALEGFFTHMPSDSNVACVVIQHLDPKHKSLMPSILAKYTEMKIQEAEDGVTVEPNSIYLTPPSKNVVILNGMLYLMEPEKTTTINLPINHFFRSLSNDRAEKAICIILSGTGTDGTLGVKEIKSAGGMAMVQDVRQAKFDGMPLSAIKTDLIDYILPVEKMPEALLNYIEHPFIADADNADISKLQFQKHLNRIFVLIRAQTGHDFSNYKQNTIQRRIERRLAVHQIENITDFIKYLQQTPEEIEKLFREMLISVTNFFRDSELFDVMKKKVLPNLFESITDDSPLRVWVPGCATGEEAYSIAILLVEIMKEKQSLFPVQIFATDIDDAAIETARQGIYPDSIAADVSAERLKKFFIKEDKKYRIKKQIRGMVVFATQSLIKDPPFSKLHLVSCRNLLIYMDQVLQRKILPLFHYTLNKDGVLILGPSESIGEFTDLFKPVDNKWRIFQRKRSDRRKDLEVTNNLYYLESDKRPIKGHKSIVKDIGIRELAHKYILDEYNPTFLILDEKLDIIYFSGETEKYLLPPAGEASFNILNMAREGIRLKISSAISEAKKRKKTVTVNDLPVKYVNTYWLIDLVIRPIDRKHELPPLFMVIFKEKEPINETLEKRNQHPRKKSENKRIAELEEDLKATKEYLQTAIEDMEALNEDQRSINEEMQSTYEQLQSSNEELETSKEELQSTNEELTTVNSELQNKIDELSHVNNDINNLLANTEIGTIFLDTDLRIKRYTPEMTKIFNLIDTDINRPISDITANFEYADLFDDAKEVLTTLVRKEIEIKNKKNIWFSVRMSPYRTTENVITGVVITFVDITKIKEADDIKRLAAVVNDSNDAITLLDLKGDILAWNKGAVKMYGYSEAEALKMNISSLVPDKNKNEMLELIEQIRTGKDILSYVSKRKTKDGMIKKIWLTITKLTNSNGEINSIATTERDMSELKN